MRWRLLVYLCSWTLAGSVAAEDESRGDQEREAQKDWAVYSALSTFAFSEPVSVDAFVNDFDERLGSGDTAFTHAQFEVGVRWRQFRFAHVSRFDEVVEFSQDTAFIHHSEKNEIPRDPTNEYVLLLDDEKVSSSGFKVGFTWQARKNLSVDVAFTYLNDLGNLVSGAVLAAGAEEPVDEELEAAIQNVIDNVDFPDPDLSPLYDLVADVDAFLRVDYHYHEPKFDEDEYREPVLTGDPNPVITGVDFSEPNGTGYSIDLGVAWQVNDRLEASLQLQDIWNRLKWDDAPYTRASLELNPLLVEAIDMAQVFADGGRVRPNDLIDRHLFVEIGNEDYTQKLPWRGDLELRYRVGEVEILSFTPRLSVLAGYLRTETANFPRVGLALGNFQVEYHLNAEAIRWAYRHRYFFVEVLTDSFDFQKAHAISFNAGLNVRF